MKEYRTTSGRVELRGDAENQRIGGLAIAYYDGTAETEYVL